MVVTLEAPSATSVGLCLAHAAADKRPWLERLEAEAAWPMSGKPRELYVDNAAEFKSEALRRGCEQHGIRLRYRPPGQPHFGGIVERLIGTMMQMVHELPGTTFSSTAERGGYDSGAKAALTLRELQRWLALAVACYHGEVHETLGRTPAAVWAEKAAETGTPATVASETAFLVDFLPVIRRTLTRSGFVIDHVQYYSDALKPWIARREQLGRFVLRRDPRDISRHLGARPRRRHLPRGAVPDAVTAADQRVGAEGRRRPAARARPRRRRRERPVRDGGADAPDHRRRRGHHPQGPPRPGAPRRDPGRRRAGAVPLPPEHGQRRRGGKAVRGDRAVVTRTAPWTCRTCTRPRRRSRRLPAEERLQHARADRWIGYTRATEALDRLETLFTWPARQRMPNLLLIGPTNNGKSMIIEKFRRSHPPVSHPDREEIPVLVVQMPSDPSVSRFYTALLAATGAPLRPRYRLADLEQLALRVLRAAGVRMLVIDELHNVLGGRGDRRREFLNLLRFLGNELRIPLVGVGHPRGLPRDPLRRPAGEPVRPVHPAPLGARTPRPARCWPASPRHSRCAGPPASPPPRWPPTC